MPRHPGIAATPSPPPAVPQTRASHALTPAPRQNRRTPLPDRRPLRRLRPPLRTRQRLGYLTYTSRLFPRPLGVLLSAGCAGYLLDTLTLFLAPDLGAALNPYLVTPAAIAEITMLFWLLVKGVKTPQQDGQAPSPPEPHRKATT
ncbi:DUF4386 domain-containing protein [Nonomuraea recticatena]|uniref:DUF4386 domain-containing protein n=1 Tax=Nonomuraea recticatena TaxID=46178 RepID=UPI0036237B80